MELLSLLSQITEPTTGQADIYGRVGCLLGVGTGFHPDLTGRENIFLNGAILGMSRADVRRRFDEIVDFAEIGEFPQTPVKHYSSGMYVRLAFSVAAHLEPEILILDEVLAVGDAAFQEKSLAKMQAIVRDDGRTVLFVHHNAATMGELCDKGIYLKDGSVKCFGDIRETLDRYRRDWSNSAPEKHAWEGDAAENDLAMLRSWVSSAAPSGEFRTDEEIEIGAEIEVRRETDDLLFGVRIHSEFGHELVVSLCDDGNPGYSARVRPGRLLQRWRVPRNMLAAGRYRVAFLLGAGFDRRAERTADATLMFSVASSECVAQRTPTVDRRGFTSLLRPQWQVPSERQDGARSTPDAGRESQAGR